MFRRLWFGLLNFGSISLLGKFFVVIGVIAVLGIVYGVITSKKFRDGFLN